MPKRKTTSSSKMNGYDDALGTEKNSEPDLSHSVLGGLKDPTLKSRITGEESDNGPDGITHYTIPFNDKHIACERHSLSDGSSASPTLIFTHGAGGGIANPATRDFAAGFGSIAPIICYQGSMNLTNRIKTFHTVVKHSGGNPALGGRSMGARAAVLTALEMEPKPESLVLVSYPLMAGSKGEKREPERREKILLDLPPEVDVLFVVGDRDAQCDLAQLTELRIDMEAKSWLVEVGGADHGMSLKQKDGVGAMRNKMGALAARWMTERSEERRCCRLEWDQDVCEPRCSEWRDETEAEKRAPKKFKAEESVGDTI